MQLSKILKLPKPKLHNNLLLVLISPLSLPYMKNLRIIKFNSSLKENINELPIPDFIPKKSAPSDDHERSVYPPNIFPISDFIMVKVGPSLSQFLWKASALNSCSLPRYIN